MTAAAKSAECLGEAANQRNRHIDWKDVRGGKLVRDGELSRDTSLGDDDAAKMTGRFTTVPALHSKAATFIPFRRAPDDALGTQDGM